ncbi:uncharacterized protein C8A04DRAFT_38412 [Dichotomopilus funicola]|uniref:BRCT domain-containing protein n=1 Tax=Dichotomopilus funicola TaxID=1934379 RepID=A0AAN6V2G5_9PEZI|nr:hypothetical protein C8A04DRAFT_38412 [Dichotomopilus funicola]
MLSNAIRQADDAAFDAVLDGTNESQDTLLIARRLMLDYGVALHSSPTAEDDTTSPSCPPQKGDSADNEGTDPVHPPLQETTRGTRAEETAQIHDSFSLPETQNANILGNQRPAETRKNWDVAIENGVVGDLNLPDSLPLSAEIDSTSRRKMDSTQASTQPNAGRSYDQYRRPSSQDRTSPFPEPVRSTSLARNGVGNVHNEEEEQREEEYDDDVGIRFDFTNITDTGKAGFVGQDDSGYVDLGSLINSRHPEPQKATQSPIQHWPETPGPPQNPFRNSRSELLSMSQLFRGTQFSSPVKLASPTSSRPSPAEFPGNSISSNPAISSPLKARGLRSSPGVAITSSPETPVVPESSHDEPGRKRSVPEPMATYEPMHKSQERRSIFTAQTKRAGSGDELDSPDSMSRRRRALQKKEAALRHLDAISFPRPIKYGDVEVPSTSQRLRESQTDAAVVQRQADEAVVDDLDNPDNLGTVEEPQDRRPKSTQIRPIVGDDSTQSDPQEEEVPTIAQTSTAAPEPPHPSTNSAPGPDQGPGNGVAHEDTILETSPTSKRVDPSLGPPPSNDPYQFEDKSTPNFQSSPPAISTRAQKRKPTRGRPRVLSSSSSPLSNLGSTPSHETSDASGIAKSVPPGSPTESTIVASSSPILAQSKRRGGHERLPKLKTVSSESLRQSRRRNRRDSNSTDELTRSLSGTPTFEQSLRVSRLSIHRSVSRAGRGATRPSSTQREQKLFKNMAFAISFQARKPGETSDQYNSRTDFSGMVQKRIRQAGGRILENGFDELFEAVSLGTPTSSPVSTNSTSDLEAEIRLTSEGRVTGFTALIADGHSRKAKYMQALALGLPCIAARWVTTCLDRNELVDWTPYLLCAGQSAFLGDAIRSRCLAPYDAATARLVDVFAAREKLLEGSRILVVVKKALEGKKVAYVFLARVLGASLTRVYNVEAAKTELKAAEDAGRPFDWVYVDGKAYEDALFAYSPAPRAGGTGGGGKRKRASAAASFATAEPPVKRVRTLGEELVIQSLILGRLIGEGEMDD